MMKKFLTSIIAIDNIHGTLGKLVGRIIEANSQNEEEDWCIKNAPYVFVDGEILSVNEKEIISSFNININ